MEGFLFVSNPQISSLTRGRLGKGTEAAGRGVVRGGMPIEQQAERGWVLGGG